MQAIVDAILYYAPAVNNGLLVGISTIGSQQAAATEQNAEAIDQLLGHVKTYPNDGILYQASDTILAAHSDYRFNNESRACSRAGAYISFLEDGPAPRWNGAVLTIA